MREIKIPINNSRIDGIQMLEQKFPSLTRRQINETYSLATTQGLSIDNIKSVVVRNPEAEIGESFEITFNYG